MSASRREVLVGGSALAVTSLVGGVAWAGRRNAPVPDAPAPGTTYPFALPSLPYAADALAPVISAETIGYHHGKHHQGYVDNLNKLVPGSGFEGRTADQIARATVGVPEHGALFRNAAQTAHHTFYWKSMTPGGGGRPSGRLLAAIEAGFGSFDAFAERFRREAVGVFGSGWCWLTAAEGAVRIESTSNADYPQGTPLLVIDVWEHAYYVDHRNRRADHVAQWVEKLANWEFAASNLV